MFARRLGDNLLIGIFTVSAPLASAVEFEEYNFENYFSHKTQYRRPPTPELEMAWARLFNCMFDFHA